MEVNKEDCLYEPLQVLIGDLVVHHLREMLRLFQNEDKQGNYTSYHTISELLEA